MSTISIPVTSGIHTIYLKHCILVYQLLKSKQYRLFKYVIDKDTDKRILVSTRVVSNMEATTMSKFYNLHTTYRRYYRKTKLGLKPYSSLY